MGEYYVERTAGLIIPLDWIHVWNAILCVCYETEESLCLPSLSHANLRFQYPYFYILLPLIVIQIIALVSYILTYLPFGNFSLVGSLFNRGRSLLPI